MKMTELITHRRSVRTFDARPLLKEDRERIMAYASGVENPFQLPITWKLLDRKKDGLSSPVITGTDTYIAGKMKREPHAEEAFGYSFEKIVLFAQSLGVGTTWIAGTMDRKAFERAMDVTAEEVMPCVSPLGYPAAKMSVRETLMRKGINANKRLAFDKLFFERSFARPLSFESAGKLRTALEMVRLAPSATNSQPWRIVLCKDNVHFYEKRNKGMATDDWDVQKIDMGIALCHFELTAAESGIALHLKCEDPGLPVEKGMVYTATYQLKEE